MIAYKECLFVAKFNQPIFLIVSLYDFITKLSKNYNVIPGKNGEIFTNFKRNLSLNPSIYFSMPKGRGRFHLEQFKKQIVKICHILYQSIFFLFYTKFLHFGVQYSAGNGMPAKSASY